MRIYKLRVSIIGIPKGVLLAISTGILGFAGALCFLYAALKGPISLVAVLSALYPIIAIVLAMFFLNETITIKQGLGIAFGLVGHDLTYHITGTVRPNGYGERLTEICIKSHYPLF